MTYFTRFFSQTVFLAVCFFVFNSCQNKEPIPLVKQKIEGEIRYMQLDIVLRGFTSAYISIRDDTDGKLYDVHIASRGEGGLFYNSFAYIDKTDLILPETRILPDPDPSPSFFTVKPIRSDNNQIHFHYSDPEHVDPTFQTKEIIGRITPATELVIGADEESIALLKTDVAVQNYLKPILLNGLNTMFAKDINPIQEGDQLNRFLLYNIKIQTKRTWYPEF